MGSNTKTVLRRAVLVPVLALLSSCAALSGYPQDPQDTAALGHLRAKYFALDATDCYKRTDCYKTIGFASQRALRDDIVLSRIHIYDMEFSLFVRDLSGANNSLSVGTDFAALALNGLGATTGDVATKAALAAASGGVLAANGAVNKDVFYQKTVPAIVAQMQADRTAAKATILAGLRLSDADYPLQRAELDLDVLNDAGSLNTAIATITQQSSRAQAVSQSLMDKLQSSAIARTQSVLQIRAWLFPAPAGTLDDAHYDQLHNWLLNNSDPALHAIEVEALADVTDDSLEAARQRAITDLKIK